MIGICIGHTSPTDVTFISKELFYVADYVSLEYDDKIVIGFINSNAGGKHSLDYEISDPIALQKVKEIESEDYFIKCNMKIIGDVNDGFKIPSTPIPPGCEVKKAPTEVLTEIFEMEMFIEEFEEKKELFKEVYK